jgi:hypothetical protein
MKTTGSPSPRALLRKAAARIKASFWATIGRRL